MDDALDSIRWGILSTAKIGTEKVIPALQQSKFGTVAAIASRSQSRAQKAADALGIAQAYGSYEALLKNKDIDAIYNPLPNHLHVPWSVKALAAGKHVLCEKPIGLSAAEARTLSRKARSYPGLKVMEAFMYRFHPQWQQIRQLLEEGSIGTLQTIHSLFTYFNDDEDDFRNHPEMGGGGLLDIGGYCISLARFIYEQEPRRLLSHIEFDPEFSVDRLASGIMEFEAGTATFSCSMRIPRHQHATLYGTKGRIEIDRPFNPQPQVSQTIRLYADHQKKEITVDAVNQYTEQGDVFAQAILNDTPVPTPLDDAIANMTAIDAAFKSAGEAQWVSLDG